MDEQDPQGDPVPIFHYAEDRQIPVHRKFFEQVSRAGPDRDPPAVAVTAIMGRNDESVPFERVAAVWRRWEESGKLPKGSRFIVIPDGDHSLTAHVDGIASAIRDAVRRKP